MLFLQLYFNLFQKFTEEPQHTYCIPFKNETLRVYHLRTKDYVNTI